MFDENEQTLIKGDFNLIRQAGRKLAYSIIHRLLYQTVFCSPRKDNPGREGTTLTTWRTVKGAGQYHYEGKRVQTTLIYEFIEKCEQADVAGNKY